MEKELDEDFRGRYSRTKFLAINNSWNNPFSRALVISRLDRLTTFLKLLDITGWGKLNAKQNDEAQEKGTPSIGYKQANKEEEKVIILTAINFIGKMKPWKSLNTRWSY